MLKIAGIVAACIALKFFTQGKLLLELILPVFVFENALQAASSSLFLGVEYELKKSYVFLLPGSFRKKLFALNLIPMVKTVVMNAAAAIVLIIMANQSVIHCFIFWLVLCSMTVTNPYSTVLFKSLFSRQVNKNGLFKLAEGLNELAIKIPAFASAYMSYLIMAEISVSLLVFAMCNLLLLGLILCFSETAFANLEIL